MKLKDDEWYRIDSTSGVSYVSKGEDMHMESNDSVRCKKCYILETIDLFHIPEIANSKRGPMWYAVRMETPYKYPIIREWSVSYIKPTRFSLKIEYLTINVLIFDEALLIPFILTGYFIEKASIFKVSDPKAIAYQWLLHKAHTVISAEYVRLSAIKETVQSQIKFLTIFTPIYWELRSAEKELKVLTKALVHFLELKELIGEDIEC